MERASVTSNNRFLRGKNMRRFSNWVGLATVGWAASVLAEGPDIFSTLDKNQDGFVTTDEVPEDKQAKFEQMVKTFDKNGDGKLSREEFSATREVGPVVRPDAAAIFEQQDANRDGKLTADEIPEEHRGKFKEMLGRLGVDAVDREQFARGFALMAGQAGPPSGSPRSDARPDGPPGGLPFRGALFKALDTNGDGELSAEEIANAPKSLLQLDKDGDGKLSARELMQGGPPGLGGPGGAAGGFNAAEMIERRIKEADKNGDHKLQKDEVSGPLAAMFDKADANGDGEIDETELRQAMERLRERLRDGGQNIREKLRELGEKK